MVKFEINLHDKKLIGQLLHFYRKYTNRAQKDVIVNEYGYQICSRKTLFLIESGELIAYDSIYEELLHNFKFRYHYEQCIDEWNDAFSQLLHYCEYYDIDNIQRTVNRLLSELKVYKNYIIFHEYYRFCEIIQWYYQEHILPDQTVIQYISGIIEILHSSLNEIMIDLLFKGCVRYELDYKKYYNFSHASNIINKMNYLVTLVYDARLQSAFEYSIELKRELLSTDNHIRLLDLYNIKLSLYKKTEEKEFLLLTTEIFSIIKNTGVPIIKKAQSYKNIAVSAYKLNLLNTAAEGLLKFLNYDKREITPYIIILVDIYQRTDNCSGILDVLSSQKFKLCENKYDAYLNYFIYKYAYHYTPVQLNNYIMKDIVDNLHDSDTIYARIFYRELQSLIKITKRYKDTSVFIEKIKLLSDFKA